MLVIAREHASPVTSVRDHSRPAPSVLSLDVNALFRFFWLRHALTNTRFRSVEIARSARAIHKEALAGARALSGTDVSNVRSRTARRALADGARARLAASVDMAHPLVEVARSLHASPFHLAHVFREEVGLSLHQYLVRLRLIAALDDLSAGATDLSRLALELGFSNHSHFSVTFRRAFGVSPSEARRRLTAASLPTDGQAWQPGVGARADSA